MSDTASTLDYPQEINVWYDPRADKIFLRGWNLCRIFLEWQKPYKIGKRKGAEPLKYGCVFIGDL